jgi:hypothetical protein
MVKLLARWFGFGAHLLSLMQPIAELRYIGYGHIEDGYPRQCVALAPTEFTTPKSNPQCRKRIRFASSWMLPERLARFAAAKYALPFPGCAAVSRHAIFTASGGFTKRRTFPAEHGSRCMSCSTRAASRSRQTGCWLREYDFRAEQSHCTQRRMAVAVPLRGQSLLVRRV